MGLSAVSGGLRGEGSQDKNRWEYKSTGRLRVTVKLAGLHSEECPHAGSFLVLPGSWAERVMLQGQGKRGSWHPLPINYSDLFLPSHLPSFSRWAIPATEKTIPRGSASLGPSFRGSFLGPFPFGEQPTPQGLLWPTDSIVQLLQSGASCLSSWGCNLDTIAQEPPRVKAWRRPRHTERASGR